MSNRGDDGGTPSPLSEDGTPLDETRAHDLLPHDVEPWHPPVKKIAERRTAGWFLAEKLLLRRAWRPAGNSRRFWARVEDDDPFLPRAPGKRMSEHGSGGLYPADRLVRMEGGRAQPAGGVKHRSPPPRPAPQARQAPEPRPAPPQPRPAPTPAPRPTPQASEPARQPQPPVPAQPAAPQVDRRPPRLPNPTVGGRAKPVGRMRVGGASGPDAVEAAPEQVSVRKKLVGSDGRSAAEIRAERTADREVVGPAPPPKLRKLDDILGILGELAASEEVYRERKARKDAGLSVDDLPEPPVPSALQDTAPRPKPRAAAPRPAPPPPAPEPPPPQPRPAPPVDRSPKAGASGGSPGGLDDLFGGAQEGRVRIGKRKLPTEEDDS